MSGELSYTPRSFNEVYCFQHIHDSVISVIQWFCHFFNNYIASVAFVRFCSNFHHILTIRQNTYMYGRKWVRKVSITRVIRLCNSLNKMFVLWLTVHTLWNQLLLQLSLVLFITKTCLYNFDHLKPHFYIVKLGFTGVYIIFVISAQKHRLWVLVRTASTRRF